jgi:hypothetical protein
MNRHRSVVTTALIGRGNRVSNRPRFSPSPVRHVAQIKSTDVRRGHLTGRWSWPTTPRPLPSRTSPHQLPRRRYELPPKRSDPRRHQLRPQ